MKLVKKNIIPSILEAIGLEIIIFVMKLGATGSIFTLWVHVITILASFAGFLLINIGIEKHLRDM